MVVLNVIIYPYSTTLSDQNWHFHIILDIYPYNGSAVNYMIEVGYLPVSSQAGYGVILLLVGMNMLQKTNSIF